MMEVCAVGFVGEVRGWIGDFGAVGLLRQWAVDGVSQFVRMLNLGKRC